MISLPLYFVGNAVTKSCEDNPIAGKSPDNCLDINCRPPSDQLEWQCKIKLLHDLDKVRGCDPWK